MKKKNVTKHALLASILAMVLCVTMLVGTTFAWFTDTASANVNKIQSGTLDVGLEMKNGDNWVDAENQTLSWVQAGANGTTLVDGENLLWEPGCTFQLQPIRVINNGNLALKYKVVIKGVEGDTGLASVIDWEIENKSTNTDGTTGEYYLLNANDTAELTISGHMQETAGNDYMGQSINKVSIMVYATQKDAEYDSEDNIYDKNAPLDFEPVATVAEIEAAMEAGKNISLTDDIVLDKQLEIKNDLTIQGNGNTLTAPEGDNKRVLNYAEGTEDVTITLNNVNLQGPTTGTYTRGIAFFGNTGKVRVVMDNCSTSANYYAINVAGGNKDIELTIKNSTVTGWCAAQTWSAGSKLTFENCTLIGNNVHNGTSDDFATIVVNEDATGSVLSFKDCRFEANTSGSAEQYFLSVRANVTIACDNCTFFKNGTEISKDDVMDYVELWEDAFKDCVKIQ